MGKQKLPINEWLRKWRKDNHYSQADIANLIGVSPVYVNSVEKGSYNRPINYIKRLKAHFTKAEYAEVRDIFIQDLIDELESPLTENE